MITRRRFLKALIAAPAAIALPSLVLAKPDIHTMVIHHEAKPKLMYLEVSARRSGKTRRLFEHMIAYIHETGNDVYYVTGNSQMFWYNINDYAPKSMKSKVKHLPLNPEEREDLRYYFDEADLVPKPLQVIRENSYYVGTPRGDTRFLYELAQHNDMQYEKYAPYYKDKSPEDWMQKDWPTKLMYKQEVLGKFCLNFE